MNNKHTFSLKLRSARQLSPQLKHFNFAPINSKLVNFIAGQFITLLIPTQDKLLRRSYSIANSPEDAAKQQQLEVAASYIPQGIGSDFLFNLKPGDSIEAMGPFGRLVLRNEQVPKRYFLIATGTGVTPYRAMLPELTRLMTAHPLLEVVLLFGVRVPEDALYQEDFLAFSQQHPQFQLRICYSQWTKILEHSHEYVGYVSESIKDFHLVPEQDIVYLCGNPNMIDNMFTYLSTQGLPSHNIRREKYISSK